MEAREAIEVGVEAVNLASFQSFHKDNVITIGKANGTLSIQRKHFPVRTLSGQDDAWEVKQRE